MPNEPWPEDSILGEITMRIDDTFFDTSATGHSAYSVAHLQSQLGCHPFLQLPQRVLVGGPMGVRYVLFMILRVYTTIHTPRDSLLSEANDCFQTPEMVMVYLRAIVKQFMTDIDNSIASLSVSSHERELGTLCEVAYSSMGTFEDSYCVEPLVPPQREQPARAPVPDRSSGQSQNPSQVRYSAEGLTVCSNTPRTHAEVIRVPSPR